MDVLSLYMEQFPQELLTRGLDFELICCGVVAEIGSAPANAVPNIRGAEHWANQV